MFVISIPEQYRNYDLCMTAVQRKGMELRYVPVALQAEIAAKDQAAIRNPVENQGILQKT